MKIKYNFLLCTSTNDTNVTRSAIFELNYLNPMRPFTARHQHLATNNKGDSKAKIYQSIFAITLIKKTVLTLTWPKGIHKRQVQIPLL